MENHDLELIQAHLKEDKDLAVLFKEHLSFEKQLAKLDNKLFLTPEEVILRKELQKKKLKGKDKMEFLLKKYRSGENNS
ncbi:MAG: DUF465 domain-containing protein [Deltaproteobacteria bacterium]|nr:DUF465 domain-containing protein [Deltaproteobacteria bacterium]